MAHGARPELFEKSRRRSGSGSTGKERIPLTKGTISALRIFVDGSTSKA